jgi:3-oxoadipate enol-lactonase
MWVDGPRRAPEDVDPGVRRRSPRCSVAPWSSRAPVWESRREALLVPDVADRLGEVRAPTLVLVGEEDVDDMHALAEGLAAGIPAARRATIPGAAHLPSLEQPAAFAALLLGFLAETLG